MSYKVEQQGEEHLAVLGGALRIWSNQEPDVHLLSIEGHRIFTQRKILSFYSSLCQKILNDPVIAFTQQIPTIFLPASATCISSLMKILISGETQSVEKESLRDVLDLADAIGIKLRNCIVDSSSKKYSNVFQFANENPLSFKKSFEKRKKFDSSSFERKNRMMDEKRWECAICFKNYKNKKQLMKHKRRSHRDKQVEDKTSDDRDIKDETIIKQEVEESSHKCTFCGEEFKYEKSYRKHIRNHENRENGNQENSENKSHNCDSCDKAFKTSSQLKQHQLTHLPDSEKPYQCELCLKRFCQQGQKIVHMKTKHSSENQVVENVEVSVEMGDGINESENKSGDNIDLENEKIDEIDNLSESVVDNFDFE